MKVFISWSGDQSKAAGLALRQWLPKVFQNIDIWMSTDIPAGAMWLTLLMEQLKGARFGIVCITPENRERSWVQFEAGAIAKAIDNINYVCPYLISLRGIDLQNNPLSNFQYKESNEKGTKELVESINQVIEKPLEVPILKETFDMWWPKLRDELSQIPELENKVKIESKPQDMLGEILEGMRRIERSIEAGMRIRTDFSTSESDLDYRRRKAATISRSRDRWKNPD
jgi:TIR domain